MLACCTSPGSTLRCGSSAREFQPTGRWQCGDVRAGALRAVGAGYQRRPVTSSVPLELKIYALTVLPTPASLSNFR